MNDQIKKKLIKGPPTCFFPIKTCFHFFIARTVDGSKTRFL